MARDSSSCGAWLLYQEKQGANMTKRHFKAFAEEIRRMVETNENQHAIETCAALVARVGSRFNPNFSIARFLEACGLAEKQS